mgnify:CR=1 FL=1|jgi:hypothetical protein
MVNKKNIKDNNLDVHTHTNKSMYKKLSKNYFNPGIYIYPLFQIITYYIIYKFTNNMKKNANCICYDNILLDKFINSSFYNIIFYFIFVICILINIFYLNKINHTYIIILNTIYIAIKIYYIISWRNLYSNIKKNNCNCSMTTNFRIINLIVWLDIVVYSIILVLISISIYYIIIIQSGFMPLLYKNK